MPPCKEMKPSEEKVSEVFWEVEWERREMEQNTELAEWFEVDRFPSFFFIHPNGEMSKFVGKSEEEDLADMIANTVNLETKK